MFATLVGFRPIDFKDENTGRNIKGVSLYIVYDSDSQGLFGQMAGKVFYTGKVDASWVGQVINMEYSFDPVAKTARLSGVNLAE